MEKTRFRPKLESMERRETPSGSGGDLPADPTHIPPPPIVIEPEIKIIIVPPPH
jgi:hypothetical protein